LRVRQSLHEVLRSNREAAVKRNHFGLGIDGGSTGHDTVDSTCQTADDLRARTLVLRLLLKKAKASEHRGNLIILSDISRG